MEVSTKSFWRWELLVPFVPIEVPYIILRHLSLLRIGVSFFIAKNEGGKLCDIVAKQVKRCTIRHWRLPKTQNAEQAVCIPTIGRDAAGCSAWMLQNWMEGSGGRVASASRSVGASAPTLNPRVFIGSRLSAPDGADNRLTIFRKKIIRKDDAIKRKNATPKTPYNA